MELNASSLPEAGISTGFSRDSSTRKTPSKFFFLSLQLFARPLGNEDITNMKSSSITRIMKTTTYILAAALIAPGAILFGLAATLAFSISASAGIAAIALNDYGRVPIDYAHVVVPAPSAKAIEPLPLAA